MKREYVNAMMGSRVHTWATPPDFYAKLDAEFGFTLDPCCIPETAKCARFFTPDDDGLAQDWSTERVFMNPPYGRALRDWMRKAWEESQRGALVVCLVPSRTGTRWWHDYAMRGEIRFVKGRIAFLLDGKPGAPAFDSAIIIFRSTKDQKAVA